MNRRRLMERLRRGHHENVGFGEFCRLVEAFGFHLQRMEGSHRAYEHPRVPILLNLQPRKGEAKGYQVRQLLGLIAEYNLTMEDER